MVAHTFNPSTWTADASSSRPVWTRVNSRTACTVTQRNSVLKKKWNTKSTQKIFRKMGGLRMYNINQSHTISERNRCLPHVQSHANNMCTHVNPCTHSNV